jgi:demethylmenaquinone methyltransferase/2-methoxy-6-polyprenyl-1,4-benzoquinol methylase
MPATDPASDVWNDTLLANPHTLPDKRSRIQKMFAAIAPSYDLNNRLHSLWMDQRWRKKAVKLAEVKPTDIIVDVACGTGDLAIAFAKKLWRLNDAADAEPKAAQVLGIDFTFEMLPIARIKAGKDDFWAARDKKQFPGLVDILMWPHTLNWFTKFINADALALPLADAHADVLSIAFGIRNVQDPLAAIKEFQRVLKPGGRLIILEFSLPTNRLLRSLYNFYFTKILPRTATLISRDKTGAYKYLPQSVNTFISRQTMQDMMKAAGFTDVEAHPLTFGICICYRGIKNN